MIRTDRLKFRFGLTPVALAVEMAVENTDEASGDVVATVQNAALHDSRTVVTRLQRMPIAQFTNWSSVIKQTSMSLCGRSVAVN